MPLSIGLDLDNTLIRYDRAFLTAANARGLLPDHFSGNKETIRDHIRASGGKGETEWQKLQGYVYGKGIGSADLFDGVKHFLARAKDSGAALTIVSHKTELGHFDPENINLRDAAKAFLKAQGVFEYIPEERIFFYSTRAEKIAQITALAFDVFVDDLEEIFNDPAFPKTMRKLFFSTNLAHTPEGSEPFSDWQSIEQAIFDRT